MVHQLDAKIVQHIAHLRSGRTIVQHLQHGGSDLPPQAFEKLSDNQPFHGPVDRCPCDRLAHIPADAAIPFDPHYKKSMTPVIF